MPWIGLIYYILYINVIFYTWSDNLFLFAKKNFSHALFNFRTVPWDQWQRLSWLWWAQRCGSSVLWPWLWAPAPESQISSPSAVTGQGSPWALAALLSCDHKPPSPTEAGRGCGMWMRCLGVKDFWAKHYLIWHVYQSMSHFRSDRDGSGAGDLKSSKLLKVSIREGSAVFYSDYFSGQSLETLK